MKETLIFLVNPVKLWYQGYYNNWELWTFISFFCGKPFLLHLTRAICTSLPLSSHNTRLNGQNWKWGNQRKTQPTAAQEPREKELFCFVFLAIVENRCSSPWIWWRSCSRVKSFLITWGQVFGGGWCEIKNEKYSSVKWNLFSVYMKLYWKTVLNCADVYTKNWLTGLTFERLAVGEAHVAWEIFLLFFHFPDLCCFQVGSFRGSQSFGYLHIFNTNQWIACRANIKFLHFSEVFI